MTDSGPLIRQLQARLDVTARDVCDAVVDQLAGYARMSTARQQGLLFDEVRYSLSRALHHSAAGEPNDAETLEFFRNQGDRSGRVGFPIADLTAAYDIAAFVAQRAFWRMADSRNYRELTNLSAWSAREVPRALDAATLAYVAARGYNGDARPGHRLVVSRLLNGESATSVATAAGVTLAPSYLVVRCVVSNADEVSAEQRARVRDCIEQVPGVLFQAKLHNLVILLPVDGGPGDVRQRAADLVASLAELTGQPLHATESYRPTLAEIPEAATEASELLRLVSALPDASSRPYVIDELLVELAIAHRPDIVQRLTDLLAALDAGPNLRHTLLVLFSCDLDRERTAVMLRIHRRTLTYRLNRIRELSGIDPTTAHGIQLLRAALTASRLTRP